MPEHSVRSLLKYADPSKPRVGSTFDGSDKRTQTGHFNNRNVIPLSAIVSGQVFPFKLFAISSKDNPILSNRNIVVYGCREKELCNMVEFGCHDQQKQY
jgi:hypothetical protein